MSIAFTCKICDTKVDKTFSKTAYTKGVVLIECPKCENRHVIADNLNWFQTGSKNIIEYLNKESKK